MRWLSCVETRGGSNGRESVEKSITAIMSRGPWILGTPWSGADGPRKDVESNYLRIQCVEEVILSYRRIRTTDVSGFSWQIWKLRSRVFCRYSMHISSRLCCVVVTQCLKITFHVLSSRFDEHPQSLRDSSIRWFMVSRIRNTFLFVVIRSVCECPPSGTVLGLGWKRALA